MNDVVQRNLEETRKIGHDFQLQPHGAYYCAGCKSYSHLDVPGSAALIRGGKCVPISDELPTGPAWEGGPEWEKSGPDGVLALPDGTVIRLLRGLSGRWAVKLSTRTGEGTMCMDETLDGAMYVVDGILRDWRKQH